MDSSITILCTNDKQTTMREDKMKKWLASFIAAGVVVLITLATVSIICLPVVVLFGLLKYILG